MPKTQIQLSHSSSSPDWVMCIFLKERFSPCIGGHVVNIVKLFWVMYWIMPRIWTFHLQLHRQLFSINKHTHKKMRPHLSEWFKTSNQYKNTFISWKLIESVSESTWKQAICFGRKWREFHVTCSLQPASHSRLFVAQCTPLHNGRPSEYCAIFVTQEPRDGCAGTASCDSATHSAWSHAEREVSVTNGEVI